ncbi:hypothetical protein F9L33_06195 [Amylibacter sp. SFDW26]|uniref:hypothetical protein n=1 Tax=Amylibacter sp. SFDW26 TaxID=2652722 RepID=UPI001262116F|nr:hypothetical protein [Amylibacter sp. SFDW26]KAB7616336.1 hypothetical protein F9L33_06195 [Amylibacter sp. SFDW26]
MRIVSEEDWKEYTFPHVTTSILATVSDGHACDMHLHWVSLLYHKYRLGSWQNILPDPKMIDDKTYLMWHNEEYCIFHKTHEKFGEHIIECAHPYSEKLFVFFDYFSLEPAFNALNKGSAEQIPYIPTYYAHPHDRYDYKTGGHLWK